MNISALIACLTLMMSMELAMADSPKSPAPDAGMLAAVDAQARFLTEEITSGDFEAWSPGLYPGFSWLREVTRIRSNGLFRVNYAVFSSHWTRHVTSQRLSILLWSPNSRPGDASPAMDPKASAMDWFAQKPHRDVGRMTRSRQGVELVADALLAARYYQANSLDYLFFADTQSLSVASFLPHSFPGSGAAEAPGISRVSFYLREGRRGFSDLVMERAPLLLDLREGQVEPLRFTLARDVSLFHLQYWNSQTSQWLEKWPYTNALPRMMQVTLGLGKPQGLSGLPPDWTSRIVALPASAVTPNLQGSLFGPGISPPTNNPRLRLSLPVPGLNPTEGFSEETTERDVGEFGKRDRTPPWHSQLGLKSDRMNDVELEWLGRSGIELARYLIAAESSAAFNYDSLNKRWAGGPGDPNSPVASAPLENYQLGRGTFSIRVADLDRKYNINRADETILRQALTLIGAAPHEFSMATDSILDWRDTDDTPRINGAESDSYRILWPPYLAKNGPFDDLSELLLVRGITPTMYPALFDLFTPVSGPGVNVNTASAKVMQLIPAIDENIAQAIIQRRAGPDGLDGTADDTPFRNPVELSTLHSLPPGALQQFTGLFTTRSQVFEVKVTARIEDESRDFVALLSRGYSRDILLLNLYRK
jgi:general secretion pathway protein K